MASNMYRVGDYVYFETTPSMPLQIRRIEELNKTQNGNVEAKVMCYFRRRDIPASLLVLADKHQGIIEPETETNGAEPHSPSAKAAASPSTNQETNSEPSQVKPEPEGEGVAKNEDKTPADNEGKPDPNDKATEVETPNEDLSAKQKQQLNQRELFLSKQVEILPATNIRGKCSVTLLNETESFSSYVDKEDAFFYTLVYDPLQRTLLADRGEIRVGSRYQAEPTPLLKEDETDDRKMEDLEDLMWNPDQGLAAREIDQFMVVARSIGTFARALDCSSSVKQPSLHMSAAAASRDITLYHAMDTLHKSGYDLGKAMCALTPQTGPILCRDQMEEWSASEANLFEEAMEKYGKDFNDVRQDFLPWKTHSSLIEYYYLWKTTDRYVQQKRVKAVESESKLKQVYIPNYNKPHPSAIGPPIPSSSKNGAPQIEIGLGPGKVCENCSVSTSVQWYAWGPSGGNTSATQSSRLCQNCWTYWKKYGDLSVGARPGVPMASAEEEPKCFSSSSSEALTSRPHRCSTQGCGKELKLKSHLLRHSALVLGVPPPLPPPESPRPNVKTRTAFYLAVTPTTRLARRFCVHLLRPKHAARFPFLPISAAAIRQEFQTRMSKKSPSEVQALMTRAQKPLTPLHPPKRIRVADLTFRLARGQIHSTTAAWLILPDRSLPKPKLAREAFPKPPKAADGSLIYEKIVLPQRELDRIKRRPDDSPSDAPPHKRSARESPGGVTSPLSILAPLSGMPARASGSPTPNASSFLSHLPGMSAMSRSNVSSFLAAPELYGVSALANSSGQGAAAASVKTTPSTHSPVSKIAAGPVTVTGGARSRASGALHGHSGGRVKQLPTWMDAPDDLFFHSTQVTKKLRRQLATQEIRRAARKPWRILTIVSPSSALAKT